MLLSPLVVGVPRPLLLRRLKHGWIKTLDPAKPATAKPFATSVRRPVDLRFTADGSLVVLLRDAWVIDKLFKGGTGVLLRIRCTGE